MAGRLNKGFADDFLGGSRRDASSSTWQNAAFVIEALVLLAALTASIAVFTSLFSKSIVLSSDATKLTRAVQLAESAADEFSSNPEAVAAGQSVGTGVAAGEADAEGLSVSVDVEESPADAGTLYTAHVSVVDTAAAASDGASAQGSDGTVIYALDVTRYVSEAR